jgi:hypothetical protein
MGIETALAIGAPLVGGLLGGKGSSQSGTQTTSQNSTTQTTLDPAIQKMIFGENGSGGLLGQYQSYLNQPQSSGAQAFGNVANNYLGTQMGSDLGTVRNASQNLINGNAAPQAYNPLWNTFVGVDAPAQNSMDLTGSYQNLLSGGNTAALDKSLQSAVAATNAGFNTNQDNVTNSLMRTVLPSIRSNSVLSGQYGGSRQGVAEGNALSDYTNQLTNANSQLAATNSANTTAQQAQAYQQGQDRALAATQGLGAQQYGVAGQNATLGQASQFANQQVGNSYNLANQQAQLTTNGQNNAASIAGQGLLSGLAGQLYGYSNANDNYDINRATQVNGLLAPYLNANSTTTSSGTGTQPLYENKGAGMLGGALAGAQLGGLFGGGKSSSGSSMGSLFDLFGSGSTFGNYA